MPVPRPSGGGRLTPISFFELDVRWLKRQGAFIPGWRREVRQTVNGRFCEQVTVCGGDSAVEVISSDGVDAPRRHRRAKVVVLRTTGGRRP